MKKHKKITAFSLNNGTDVRKHVEYTLFVTNNGTSVQPNSLTFIITFIL